MLSTTPPSTRKAAPVVANHVRHVMPRQANPGGHVDLIEARPLAVRRLEEIDVVEDPQTNAGGGPGVIRTVTE